MHICVSDILDLLSFGFTNIQVIEEFDSIEIDDVLDCLQYESLKMNHSINKSA